MQSQINQLIAWHAKLNIRERILVGLGAVAAVWMVWLFAVWDVLRVCNTSTEYIPHRK